MFADSWFDNYVGIQNYIQIRKPNRTDGKLNNSSAVKLISILQHVALFSM